MAAYDAADQVSSGSAPGVADYGTWNVPNFVGELFRLSPTDYPFLAMIGGLTGGVALASTQWTWQDTIHRAPEIQSIVEGDDAVFTVQKRNERKNVAAIHQYGVELTYTKQAATGQLGTSGDTPDIAATSILGTQPVMDEMSWQLVIKLEQAGLDVEAMFLDGTLANPADGTARQTQGIVGAVSGDTTTDYVSVSDQTATRAVINDLTRKLYINGARFRNCIIFVGARSKEELGDDYGRSTDGWNQEPRSGSMFGVNIETVNTEQGQIPIALNRHLDVDTVLIVELSVCQPRFLPIRNKGHFFMEPLAKSGSYDRAQLYGEIGLEYGPSGWHAIAENLHTP
jgi:hypothetical protein